MNTYRWLVLVQRAGYMPGNDLKALTDKLMAGQLNLPKYLMEQKPDSINYEEVMADLAGDLINLFLKSHLVLIVAQSRIKFFNLILI